MQKKQIFYDQKKRRWKYLRAGFSLSLILYLVIFGVVSYSLAVQPKFNPLNLLMPQADFRGVPNVHKNPIAANNKIEQKIYGISPTEIIKANIQKEIPVSYPNLFIDSDTYAFYVNWDPKSFSSLKQNIFKLDGLIPEWLHLGENGEIIIDDPQKQKQALDFINKAKPDLPIYVLINNFNSQTQSWDPERAINVLKHPYYRDKAIENIHKYVEENNFKGASVDFEGVPLELQVSYVSFLKSLHEKFHPQGLEISVNVPLDDPAFDVKSIANHVDRIILMAYDQNTIFNGAFHGPIASQKWLEKAIEARFKDVSSEKFILSIGGYGYDWDEKDPSKSKELNFEQVSRLAGYSDADIVLDPGSLNPNFDYYDENNNLHHVWYLDAVTAFNQVALSKKLGSPEGFAVWRMGSEDPGIWEVLDSGSVLDKVESLKKIDYGSSVMYEGSGEIIRVSNALQVGKRELNYDETSGYIVEEKITKYPSSYVISRWGGQNKKKIVLTFDDGPDQKYTPLILDILKQHNVPAAFFVVGLNANLNPHILKRILNEGHEIGNHTYSHPNISKISSERFSLELGANERLLEGILGIKSLLFRPPYAEDVEPMTPEQLNPLIKMNHLGYYTVAMNIDPLDWSKPGADEITRRVVEAAKAGEGNVVLLHDGGGNRDQTIEALPKIIEQLRINGFELASISDLISLPKEDLMPKLSPKERMFAYFNGAAFMSISFLGIFIRVMFFAGIVLGVIRFIFIGILAIIQYLKKKKPHNLERHEPEVSIIVPAYNEEKVVKNTIDSLLKSGYDNYEIIVVDDGSTDSTYKTVLETFGDNPKVRIFSKENGGKSNALNFAVNKTAAEIIITLDADTIFKSDTVKNLVTRFEDPVISAVAGNAKVGNRNNLLTRWQALEYITSQNLDRRAMEMVNSILVVPGAVGAWRRQAIVDAGGFSSDTLAEDADLTFEIIKRGGKIVYEDSAIAYTEAPESVRNFLKQRFRWMYGTLQTAWKHKGLIFFKNPGGLGYFGIPNVFIFQVFFPLISPIMDLIIILSIGWAYFQWKSHPIDFSAAHILRKILIFYLFFTAVDFITALIPFVLEKKENWKLIFWLPLQRFFYRQLMYYVAIKSVIMAVRGKLIGWNKFERKATVIRSGEFVIHYGQIKKKQQA